jgi:hypothetical protein
MLVFRVPKTFQVFKNHVLDLQMKELFFYGLIEDLAWLLYVPGILFKILLLRNSISAKGTGILLRKGIITPEIIKSGKYSL